MSLDDRDRREIALRLHLVRYAGADPATLVDDVGELLDDHEQQEADLREAEDEAAKLRPDEDAEEEKREALAVVEALPRVLRLLPLSPLYAALLLSGASGQLADGERYGAVLFGAYVLPLLEYLFEAHRDQERARERRQRERERLVARYERDLTKEQLLGQLRAAGAASGTWASVDKQALAGMSKASLAEALARVRCPEPHWRSPG